MMMIQDTLDQAKLFSGASEYDIRTTVVDPFEEEVKPALKAQQTFDTASRLITYTF